MAIATNKGQKMEELLRIYFLKSGYYVTRGVPFKYQGFDVTDIDLWLYNRTTPVSREISIVDIKNKRTPQAIERIFWVKGLQLATKATNALVATTDKRSDVKDFGKDMNVFVLDGNFLTKIYKFEKELENRLTDEGFQKLIDSYSLGKLDGDWKRKLIESKGLLASGLNFDNINNLMEYSHFFLEQILTKPSQTELALRCFYLICSYISVNIDYLEKDLSFLDNKEAKIKTISDGFRYGSKGEKKINQIIDMSLSFVEQYSNNGKTTANQARHNIRTQLENIQTNILADYFSNYEVSQNIFKTAIEFEQLAMNKVFVNHSNSSISVRGFISVLLDFYSIDRVKFSEAAKV